MIRKIILTIVLIGVGFGFADKKSARLAMLLCFMPGGGQFYTERYVPGIILGGGEITLSYFAYKSHQEKDYARRNSLLWWDLFVFGYSLADAYVGAKLYGFRVETDINRVSIRYDFKLKW
jgi:hypothetical protein